jgi:hypothetical protein
VCVPGLRVHISSLVIMRSHTYSRPSKIVEITPPTGEKCTDRNGAAISVGDTVRVAWSQSRVFVVRSIACRGFENAEDAQCFAIPGWMLVSDREDVHYLSRECVKQK